MEHKSKPKLVVVSAKIPTEIRELIEQKAKTEERSLSQTISRLFSSHPDLKNKPQQPQEVALPA
jgi:hypothetical protein